MMVASPGFTWYDNTNTLPSIANEVPSIERFIIMDDIEGKYRMPTKLDRSVEYEDYINRFDASATALPQVSVSPHDMVNVQFTSGR